MILTLINYRLYPQLPHPRHRHVRDPRHDAAAAAAMDLDLQTEKSAERLRNASAGHGPEWFGHGENPGEQWAPGFFKSNMAQLY